MRSHVLFLVDMLYLVLLAMRSLTTSALLLLVASLFVLPHQARSFSRRMCVRGCVCLCVGVFVCVCVSGVHDAQQAGLICFSRVVTQAKSGGLCGGGCPT